MIEFLRLALIDITRLPAPGLELLLGTALLAAGLIGRKRRA